MITIEKIKEIVVEIVPSVSIDSIDNHMPLRDYEIDSLDFFNIILELQNLSGIQVPDEDIDQLSTVHGIFEYFIDK